MVSYFTVLLVSSTCLALECYIKSANENHGKKLVETVQQNGSCLFTYENPCPHTGERLTLSSFTSSAQKQPDTWLCQHTERNLRCVCREDLCNSPTGVMEMVSLNKKAFTKVHEKRSITQESDVETSLNQQGITPEATRPIFTETTSIVLPSHAETDAIKTQVTTSTNMNKLGSTTTQDSHDVTHNESHYVTHNETHDVTHSEEWLQTSDRVRDNEEGEPARQFPDYEASSSSGLTVVIILAGGLMGSAFIVVIMILFLHESRKNKTTKVKKTRS